MISPDVVVRGGGSEMPGALRAGRDVRNPFAPPSRPGPVICAESKCGVSSA